MQMQAEQLRNKLLALEEKQARQLRAIEVKQEAEQIMESQHDESSAERQYTEHYFMKEISRKIAGFMNGVIQIINNQRRGKKQAQRTGGQNQKKSGMPSQQEEEKKLQPKLQEAEEEDSYVSSSVEQQMDELDMMEDSHSNNEGKQRQAEEMEMKELHIRSKLKENKLQNTPKKPVSSFFFYYQEQSRLLAQRHNELVGARVAKLVADSWRKMTAEQKKPYYDMANATKETYRREMAEYIREHEDEIQQIRQLKRLKNNTIKKLKIKNRGNGDEIQESSSSIPEDQAHISSMRIKGISQRQMKLQERKQYSHRPKAPVSSFFLFYQQEARNIASHYGETVGSKLAKLASNVWKKMPMQAREKYEVRAKQNRQKYHQEMMQYRIQYPQEIENRRQKISHKMRRKKKLLDSDQGSKDGSALSSSEDIDSNDMEPSDSYQSSQIKSSGSKNQMSLQINDIKIDSEGSQNIQKMKKKRKQKVQSLEKKSRLPRSDKPKKQRPKRETRENSLMPHKPKGPIGSFFQYYHSHLRDIMAENKDVPGAELVKIASRRWKGLNQEERAPFEKLAEEDRQKYYKQVQQFRVNYPQEYKIQQQMNRSKHLGQRKRKRGGGEVKYQE